MAYNFLNTTTYDSEQEGLFNYIANAALTNAGASLSMPDNAEPDLVEITHDDYSAPQSDGTSEEQPDIEEQPNTSDDEFFKEPDEKVDLDLLSSLFDTSEEDNDALKQQVQDLQDKAKVPNRTYHVEDDNSGEDDNSHTYLPSGKVAPRIWQYGGEPSKYQVGGVAMPHTNLTPTQDSAYQTWKTQFPPNLQYEEDYNLKQLWLENPTQKPSANMHFPDRYKLPNHPTFSNESMYFNPTNQYLAGHWQETDSSWNYIPYNSQYKNLITEKKQNGGVLYADDRQTQRIGLNDSNYREAHFSTSGTNTFRGLDNYQPVYVTDGSKYRILKGPNDSDTFKGKVYEKRMQVGGNTSNNFTLYGPTDTVKSGSVRRIKRSDVKVDLPDASIASPIDFINSYFNSGEFRKRSGSSYASDMAYFNNGSKLYNVKSDTGKGSFAIPSNVLIKVPQFYGKGNDPTITIDNNEAIKEGYDIRNDVYPHEYSHTLRRLGYNEEKQFVDANRSGVARDFFKHYNEDLLKHYNDEGGPLQGENFSDWYTPIAPHEEIPNENYADLNTLRWNLYKKGIYDTRKGPMKLEHIQKAMQDPTINKSPLFKRILRSFTPEDIVRLNNTVATNDNINTSPYA